MKKKILLVTVVVMIITLATAIVFFALSHRDEQSAVLYYLSADETEMIAENISFTVDDTVEIPLIVINELKASKHGNKNPVNENCSVNKISYESTDKVRVELSSEFLCDNPHKNVMRTLAVIKSICSAGQYYGVTSVLITVDNAPIITSDGEALGYLSESDISRRDDGQESLTYECILYYKDKASGTLRAEQRRIDAGGYSIEQNIVNALIDGPASNELVRTLPKGAVLISAQTVKGICFVNFKSFDITENIDTAVLSIVKTLISLENVDSVQILIDGKTVEKIGGIDVSSPIK